MKNNQSFNSNSKEQNSKVLHSSEGTYTSFSENDLTNRVLMERDCSISISSLEQVIINDPGYNGTLFSSVLTMCSTIFGAGMLTIPYAIATIGLGNGIIAIIFFGLLAMFTLYLLAECAKIMGGRNVSFFSLSSRSYPRLSIIFDLAIAIKCFGVSISYLVIVGELLPKVIIGFFPDISKDSVLLTRLFWITLCMLIVIPLAFQKSLSSLRYASTVSLIAVNYIALLVACFYFKGNKPVQTIDDGSKPSSLSIFNATDDVQSPSNHPVEYFKWSIDFFRVLPIFVFAYTCHQNLLTVFNEMKITSRRTDNRYKKTCLVLIIAISIAITIYLIIGITGYLTYGNTTKSNIISMYPPSNKFVLGGQSLMALMVCISYSLQCNPARKSFGNVINYLRTMKKRSGYEPLYDGENSPILRNDESNTSYESSDYSKENISIFKTKSQPSLTSPLTIKKNLQDSSNNFASSSLASNTSASSSSVVPQKLKDQKIGVSKSYNDLYYLLNNNKEYKYHSINVSPNEINTHSIQSQSFELSNTMHNVITTCLLTISYIIACSVNDLGVVLSVVGATGSTTICFILPSLLYYKIKKNERGNQKSTLLMKVALAITFTGILLMMNSLFFIFVKI